MQEAEKLGEQSAQELGAAHLSQSETPSPTGGEYGLEEQPGGRIVTLSGEPVAARSLYDETRQAFHALCDFYAWVGPLVEAALVLGRDRTDYPQAKIITPWGNDQTGEHADEAKHLAYVAHVKKLVAVYHPYLWPLFDAARALVLMTGETFTYTVATRPGAQWDVPAMLAFTVIDGETLMH